MKSWLKWAVITGALITAGTVFAQEEEAVEEAVEESAAETEAAAPEATPAATPAVVIQQSANSTAVVPNAAKKAKPGKSTLVQQGDTYNFYFQKAPGPTTVNQGTSAAPAKAPAPAAKDEGPEIVDETGAGTSVAKESVSDEKKESANFSLSLLYGGFKDNLMPESGDGFGFGVGYRFTPMLGIGIDFHRAVTNGADTKSSTSGWSSWSWTTTARKEKRTTITAHLEFLPLQFATGAQSGFELGIVAGLMNVKRATVENELFLFVDGLEREKLAKSETTLFGGPILGFKIARNFGVSLQGRFAPDNVSSVLGGVKVMF